MAGHKQAQQHTHQQLDCSCHPFLLCRYEEGQNISRLHTLVDVGEQLGLPGVTAYLSGQEGLDEVRQDDAFGKRE